MGAGQQMINYLNRVLGAALAPCPSHWRPGRKAVGIGTEPVGTWPNKILLSPGSRTNCRVRSALLEDCKSGG